MSDDDFSSLLFIQTVKAISLSPAPSIHVPMLGRREPWSLKAMPPKVLPMQKVGNFLARKYQGQMVNPFVRDIFWDAVDHPSRHSG